MTTKESFQRAVAKRINGDKNHGWGIEDSLAVVVDLLTDEGCEPTAECQCAIREVINPSQFRQKLETKGALNKQPSKKAFVESMLADFKA